MIIKKEEIDRARENIIKHISNQATYGVQTEVVKKIKNDYYALGQFIGDNKRHQRGIHGTANGLRVLAESDSEVQLISGLKLYLEERLNIENQITGEGELIELSKLQRDENNIIKLSEILYALSFVKPGHASSDDYIKKISAKLIETKFDDSGVIGWGYFGDDETKKPELLPTSFAMLALEKSGFNINDVKKSLQDIIEEKGINDPSVFSEVIFCLYALINTEKNRSVETNKKYSAILATIWSSPYCTLQDDYEQNLEYWHHAQHDYVRIPWQPYLIAITCAISKRRFYTVNVQKRLISIITQAKGNGFKYPYSGPYLSTRTNAIIFDCLTFIRDNLQNHSMYGYFVWLDGMRQFLGSKFVKNIGLAIGTALMVYSIFLWVTSEAHDFGDIAPNLFADALVIAISLGKRK